MILLTAEVFDMGIATKEKLKHLRGEKGWGRSETARQAKIPAATYQSYEQFNRKPSGEYALALAKALGVTVEYLLDEEKGYPPIRTDLLTEGTQSCTEKLDISTLTSTFQVYLNKHPEKLEQLSPLDIKELASTCGDGGKLLDLERWLNKRLKEVETSNITHHIRKAKLVKKKNEEEEEELDHYREGLKSQPRELMVSGFNMMLEMILVVVIVGILAVVAVPKFMDLSAQAERGVAKGITATIRGCITILHSRVLLGGSRRYDETAIVAGVDAEEVTLGAGEGVITATFPSGNTYTWGVEGPTLPTTMAIIKPNF